MALPKEEIQRKLLHVLFGALIPAGIFYIPKFVSYKFQSNSPISGDLYPVIILLSFMVGFIFIEVLRFRLPWLQSLFLKYFGSMLREKEKGNLTGATYIVASSLICSIIFLKNPHISFIVLCTFIWGDAIAAIVGQSIGNIKIGKKSLEGSLACFFLCFILLFWVFPNIPLLLDIWNGKVPLPLIIITSLCITLFELFPLKISKKITINDNLSVPVITGFIMLILYPLM